MPVEACSDDEEIGGDAGRRGAETSGSESDGPEDGQGAVNPKKPEREAKGKAKAKAKGRAQGKRKVAKEPAGAAEKEELKLCLGHCGQKKLPQTEFHKDQRKCKCCGNDEKRFKRICEDQEELEWFTNLKSKNPKDTNKLLKHTANITSRRRVRRSSAC